MSAPRQSEEVRYDAVVIGAGAGGLTVAIGLARLGRRVALVERAEVGGDCTNTGCIPSKRLIELARELPSAASPDDVATLLERVRALREEVRHDDEALLAAHPGLTLVRGEATLAAAAAGRGAPDVVVSRGDAPLRLRARHVVLAVGAAPRHLELPGLARERCLTSDDVFDLEAPPASLAVLGGGAMGVELSGAFARLGVPTTLVERADRLLPAAEGEAAAIVRRALERRGVVVHTGTEAVGWHADELELRRGDGERLIAPAARVLVAIGRRPRSDGLGLEALGLAGGGAAVVTDSQHRTGVPGLWAIGDVTGRATSSHAANEQGRRLVRRLALPLPLVPEGDYPSVVFGEPEVAQIGPLRAELVDRYGAELVVSQRVALAETDRGRTQGLREGYLELHAMRLTGRLLAATLVGPHASELLALLTLAQRRRLTLWRLSRAVAPYPTFSGAVRSAADAFVFATLPALPRETLAYLRHRLAAAHRPGTPKG
jgi:dihydrolipoamide dehydrogenase